MAITPLMPVYPRSPVRPVRGEGVYLYGEQGEKYLDFAAASRSTCSATAIRI
jgi:acetylornithine/N-succinyldiaminopimelate aminotransferase